MHERVFLQITFQRTLYKIYIQKFADYINLCKHKFGHKNQEQKFWKPNLSTKFEEPNLSTKFINMHEQVFETKSEKRN